MSYPETPELITPLPATRRSRTATALQRVVGRVLPFVDPVVKKEFAAHPESLGGLARKHTHASGRIAILPMHNVVLARSAEASYPCIDPQIVRDIITSWPPLGPPETIGQGREAAREVE